MTPAQALHAVLGENMAQILPRQHGYGGANRKIFWAKKSSCKWAADHGPSRSMCSRTDTSFRLDRSVDINKELIAKYMPGPDEEEDIQIFICGPPCTTLDGSSCEEKGVRTHSKEMGYKTDRLQF
jgi:hypothetical protein